MFDDHNDVTEKTVKVTIPSLPKENGVPVKVSVIELRSRQAKLFLAKYIHGCVFRRDRALSRIPVKKLKRLSQKLQKIRILGWKGIHTDSYAVKSSSLC